MSDANVNEIGVELERIVEAAKDSVTDDIVGRLASTTAGSLDLLDKINSSGIEKALPVLAQMVENGDLQRVAQLARLYTAAEDSVTDDMIGRLGETVGGALLLADQAGRSRIAEALPVIDHMVATGDLRRVADLARLVGAAEDAVTDDMVGRLAEMAGEAISVVDRLNRSGVGRLVEVLEKLDASGGLDILAETLPKATEQLSLLADMSVCLEHAIEEVKTKPSSGGIFGLLGTLRDKDNQDFIRFVLGFGRRLKERCFSRGQ